MKKINEKEYVLRQSIIDAALALEKKKLNQCKSGNISIRWKDGLLITPSGISYNKLKPEDIVFVDKNKKHYGKWKPSSETPFHFDILKSKKEINVVIHTHSPYGTGLSILGKPIPCFHYMIAFFGGDTVPCAKFAPPGSQELSDNAVKALKRYKACLLANHGVIVTGSDLEEALILTEELEVLCQQITIAKINGTPKLVGKKDMQKIIEAVKTYGKQ